MRVLVTRPEPEAAFFAAGLAARGHDALISPLLSIDLLPIPPDFDRKFTAAQAILLTSINGARALAAATTRRDRPVLAVGDATAGLAEAAGFDDVRSAEGDGAALVELVKARLDPARGALLHVGGEIRAGDPTGDLRRAGFEAGAVALYAARTAEALAPAAVAAIRAGEIDAVTLFSPRTATTFARLAEAGGLAAALRQVTAIVVSPATAEAAGQIAWRRIVVAERPTQAAMVMAIEAAALAGPSGDRPTMSEPSPPADKPDTPRAGAAPSASADSPAAAVAATAAAAAHVAAVTRPPRRGVGVVGAFATGLVASGVVAAGVVGLHVARPGLIEQTAHMLTGTAPAVVLPADKAAAEAVKPLAERLAKLEAGGQLAPLQDALAKATARLDAHDRRAQALQDLAARVDALATSGASVNAGRVETEIGQLRGDLAGVRADLATAQAALKTVLARPADPPAPTGDQTQALAALTDRLARLERRDPAAPAPAAPPAASAPPATADQTQALAVLSERLAQIERRPPASTANLAERADVEKRLAELETRLRGEIARVGGDGGVSRETATQTAQRLAVIEKDMTARLAALDKGLAATGDGTRRAADNGRAAAAIGVAGRLRQAIDAGVPFATDAELLKPLAGGDPDIAAALQALAPLATTGVVPLKTLALDLPQIARAVIAADLADDSWGERMLGKLRALVSIRRVGGDSAGDSSEAIMARAEAALAGGELAKAVTELKGLTGAAMAPAVAWLAKAETNLAAQRAVDRLSLHGIALLSRGGIK